MSEPQHPPVGATAWSGTPGSAPTAAYAAVQGPTAPGPTEPPYSDGPVPSRRPASLGGLLVVLAGIAAAVSLPLDWLAGRETSGWSLVRSGFGDLGGIFDDGLWQPLVIVLGGGVLFVLGILLWLPRHSHRFFGLLALVVTAGVAAGVLVPLAVADWDLGFFAIGFWLAIAIAVLGLLGSLKAVLTPPPSAGAHRGR